MKRNFIFKQSSFSTMHNTSSPDWRKVIRTLRPLCLCGDIFSIGSFFLPLVQEFYNEGTNEPTQQQNEFI